MNQGEIVRFFADANAPVNARVLDENRAEISNPGHRQAKVSLIFVGNDGKERLDSIVLRSGQRRVVTGSSSESSKSSRD